MSNEPIVQRNPFLAGGEGTVLATQAASTERKRLPFRVDVPFTKAATLDESGNLELVGYASTWVEDRDGEWIDPRAFDESLPPYLQNNPILLWQHNQDWPIGQIVEAQVDANGLAVRAVVRKPKAGEEPWKISAYEDIKAGIVRTFSIGGFFTRDFAAGRVIILFVELLEISVVSIPSNPASIFEAAQKALGKGIGRPLLPTQAVAQMEQLLGLREVSDPELRHVVQRGAAAMDARYEMLAGLYTAAGKLPPGRTVWDEAKAEPDVRKRLTRVMEVMQLVQGGVDAKAGRVLSKANEEKLRHAAGAVADAASVLAGVLAQVEAAEEAPDAEAEAAA